MRTLKRKVGAMTDEERADKIIKEILEHWDDEKEREG